MLRSLMTRAILLAISSACLGVAPRTTVAGVSTIADAWICQSGEVLWVRPLKADGTSALGAVPPVADGACTITKGGVGYPLAGSVRSVGMEGFFFPLLPDRVERVADDGDAGRVAVGAWANKVGGVDGHFGEWDAKGAQFRVASDPAATYTWPTFTGLVPGRYLLSDHVGGLTDPANTTRARYTVKAAGSGRVLATFGRDLRTQVFPRFDGLAAGMETQHLGYFVLPPGETAATVTLSNAGGSGSLVADAVALESRWEPFAAPGDEVAVHFPAGALAVSGDANAETTIAVRFVTDREFCGPVHAPGDRTLKAGVNVDGIRETEFPQYTADRAKGCDAWAGGVTLDARYQMASNDGTAHRTMLYYPCGDGLSPRGMYSMDDGVVRVEFNVSGAPFDEAARAACGIAPFNSGNAPYPPAPAIGPKTWTDLGGGRWRLLQHVARPAWTPISGRPAGFSPYWTQGIQFNAYVPGLIVTDWSWYDPRVPLDWDKVAHPDEVARIGGAGLVVRGMNTLATNFSKAKEVGDFTTDADQVACIGSAPTPSGNPEYVIWRGNLVSVRPADLTEADTDDVRKRFPLSGYDGFFVATFDAPVAGYPDGNNFALRTTSATDVASTIPGHVVSLPFMYGAFKIAGKPNELVVASASSNAPYPTTDGERATIDGTHALAAATGSVFKNNLLPYETFLRYCNDVGGEPWVNVPHLASDALIDWMADRAIALSDPDTPHHLEYSNETWNANWVQFHYFSYAWQYANYLHSVDPVGHPLSFGTPNQWVAHQAGHVFGRWRARWAAAGRDPGLVRRHLCVLTQNYGVTEEVMRQCAAEGIDFDFLGLDAYQDANPPGFVLEGPDLAATARRISADGMLDILYGSAFHGIRHLWSEGHRQRMAAAGARYAGKFLSAYEGGWSYLWLDPAAPEAKYRTYEMMASRRMHYATAAKLSLYQDIFFRVANKYVLAFYSIPGNNVAWSDLYSNRSMLGTGGDGQDANPYYWPDSTTQTLGGRVAFASGFDFDRPAGPVDPPTRPPTTGAVIAALKAATAAQMDAVAAAAAAGNRSVAAATSAAARAVLDLADVLVRYLSGPTPAASPAP